MAEGTAEPQPLRRRGLSLFHVAGIEVRLDYSWFLIFALILGTLALGYFPREYPDQPAAAYWAAGALATVLLFLSILAHELSHALVARQAGIPVPAITLFLFGGVSHMEREASDPGTEFRVAVAGPLTSFALGALFWAAYAVLPEGVPGLAAGMVAYLGWINVALGVFNLLPGYPLDGGRVLRAVAWWRTGSLIRATRLAADWGKGLAVGLMVLGGIQIFAGGLVGGLWLVLIGLFLRGIAEAGYQSVATARALEDARVADAAIARPLTVGPDLPLQRFVEDCLLEHGHRAYPVVVDGRPVGLISLEDLKGLPPEKRATTTVGERMRRIDDALRVAPELGLKEALERLQAAPGGRLLVVRDGELEGLLTANSLARFIQIRRELGEGE